MSQSINMDQQEQVARTARAIEETLKFVAEQHKLMAEREKLAAEAQKLRRDWRFAPWVLGLGLGGGVFALLNLLIQVLK